LEDSPLLGGATQEGSAVEEGVSVEECPSAGDQEHSWDLQGISFLAVVDSAMEDSAVETVDSAMVVAPTVDSAVVPT